MAKKEDFKFEIDNTRYYGDIFSDKKKKVKCALCGKIHFYRSGEMIYKHNRYKFCSYSCRSKWRKEHPNEKPDNPYILATSKYDGLL